MNDQLEIGTKLNPMYQRMTNLPEALERALLKRPLHALVEACGWAGASEKYTCVQFMARTWDQKRVKEWLDEHPAGNDAPQHAEPDPTDDNPIKEPRISKVQAQKEIGEYKRIKLTEDSVVQLKAGVTTIQPGSMRAKVLAALKEAPHNSATIGWLTERCSFDAKPVVAKLREAGWCEVLP